MKPQWTIEDLEAAVESGTYFDEELLVGDSVEVLGDYGDVATVCFHFEGPGGEEEESTYEFTFNNRHSLQKNFEELWESVEQLRTVTAR